MVSEIEKLRRDIRQLRRLIAFFSLLFACWAIIGATSKPGTVEASKFVLRGRDGKVLGTWEKDKKLSVTIFQIGDGILIRDGDHSYVPPMIRVTDSGSSAAIHAGGEAGGACFCAQSQHGEATLSAGWITEEDPGNVAVRSKQNKVLWSALPAPRL